LAIAVALLSSPLRAADEGNAAFTKRCASCHAEDGRGNVQKATLLKLDPKLLDFARPEAASLGTADLHKAIAEGKHKMPAYGTKLTPAEIDALVAHVEKLRQAAK
jgi:mono/diheme cytochrome c family protein